MDFRQHLTPYATRKPASWDDAPEATDQLKDWDKEMLRRLPVIETDAAPGDNFLGDEPPTECVVRVGARAFYVNPEGYSYARYAFEFNPAILEQ